MIVGMKYDTAEGKGAFLMNTQDCETKINFAVDLNYESYLSPSTVSTFCQAFPKTTSRYLCR